MCGTWKDIMIEAQKLHRGAKDKKERDTEGHNGIVLIWPLLYVLRPTMM